MWPVTLAAVAAALAWLLAHRVLGHQQPFFAPIAAAISLSTSQIQRSRRIAQMVAGVLLGIGIGEALQAALGTSTAALGVIVLVTMIVALAVGAGFFGQGMMFPNQAVASAILVVTVHHHGTGAERGLDAVVGGAVALVIGVALFPSEPLSLLRDAERAVLRALARKLREVDGLLRSDSGPEEGWTLQAGYEIHQELGSLARARATAHTNVRVAPRRWRLRAVVDAENRRTAQLDLLANAVLSLIRAATIQLDGLQALPTTLEDQIAALGLAIERLADTAQPWPAELVGEVHSVAAEAIAQGTAQRGDRGPVVAAILRSTATDLLRVMDVLA